MKSQQSTLTQLVSISSLIVTLGIIFGDIGTSPLYVMKAIIGQNNIRENIVLGAVSCVFYTLTLQTTIKYVLITIRADNHGEGGIFSLYSLLRKLKLKWLVIPAVIGGCSLLADSVITPAISISSAVEGLKIYFPEMNHIYIVIAILFLLFFIQQFGTQIIGKSFGPIMLIWFVFLGVLGVFGIYSHPEIFHALNPIYAFQLLKIHPEGFYVLGFVFLCTTGAEALYSDLGHCGRKNVQYSWIFVKTMLLLNYFGQGAYLLKYDGWTLAQISSDANNPANPFFMLMPNWLIPFGIIIATLAAIIASQALITGAFSLISEAIRLNLWPRIAVKYPTSFKGQTYLPSVNWLLFAGCVFVMWHFKKSSEMEAAYGLAIVMCMLMTTLLLAIYLRMNKISFFWIALFVCVYGCIEISFFIANISKFYHGGYVSLFIAFCIALVMLIWYFGKKITNIYNDWVPIDKYVDVIKDLSRDESLTKYASQLVYLASSDNPKLIDSKIIYSILKKRPKRADTYWFLHLHVTDQPYQSDYKITWIEKNTIIRIDFYLGFKVTQRVNVLFKNVLEHLIESQEINVISKYDSLQAHHIPADFKYVLISKIISHDSHLPWYESMIMSAYVLLKKISLSDGKAFGLDSSSVKVEEYPVIVHPISIPLRRI